MAVLLTSGDHLQTLHGGASGYVTLARKQGGYQQHHYSVAEAEQLLHSWIGVNSFVSQSTFYIPARRLETLRELRALWVDVDCGKVGLTPWQVLMAMEAEHYRRTMPEPGLEMWTGRNLALVWLIKPEKALALPRWQAAQDYLTRLLLPYGADLAAADPTRILRLADSVNGKNGQTVLVYQRHAERPALDQIMQEYLPAYNPPLKRTPGVKRANPARLLTRHSLHHTRLLDLVALAELRKWQFPELREVVCFLYRYWACCFLSDAKEALRQTVEFAAQFADPLPLKEVIKATRSAEKAWGDYRKAEVEGRLQERGRGRQRNGYNYSTAKLLEMLRITPDEQRLLRSMIGRAEKYRRWNVKRKTGKQADARGRRVAAMQKAIDENPGASNRQLARILGVSDSTVRNDMRYLNGNH